MVTHWESPGNPESRRQLRQLSLREILELLARIGFERIVDGFERDDLVSVAAQLVAENPAQLVPNVELISGLPVDAARAMLGGVVTALNNKVRTIPWSEVLAICAAQLRSTDAGAGSGDPRIRADNGIEVARLIGDALVHDTAAPIPFALRSIVWDVIARLMKRPDPRPTDESPRDPYDIAINSVRGVSLETVLRYAYWVRRSITAEAPGTANSFESFPEVQELLDQHLNSTIEPSPAVRSIYGVHLADLFNLDPAWLRRAIGRIFPPEGETLLDASWRAFVLRSYVPTELLPLLRPLYERALSTLVQPTTDESREYRNRLAQHIVLYYWHGVITLDDPLLQGFFADAPPDVRGFAIAGTGHMLKTARQPDPDTLARLRELWNWRLQSVKELPSLDNRRAELEDFGYWFASERFDDAWVLDQLIATIQLAGEVEPDTIVAERVAGLAPRFVERALAFAELAVAGARRPWWIYAAQEHLRTIIEQARNSQDPALIRRADELLSRMAARGS